MAAPRSAEATGGLTLATYNIHRAVGSDGRRMPRRIVSVIREIDPDIVGLQEVDWREPESQVAAEFELLADLPGYTPAVGPNIRDHRGHYGNMLLARYPIRALRLIDLSEPGREPRGAIDADIETPGYRLRVIVTHLGLRGGERRRQAQKLRAALRAHPGQCTIVLGDFNDWLPATPTLRPLTELCRSNLAVRSYPARRPLLALDRILLHGHGQLEVASHRSSLARVASDHLPLVGTWRA